MLEHFFPAILHGSGVISSLAYKYPLLSMYQGSHLEDVRSPWDVTLLIGCPLYPAVAPMSSTTQFKATPQYPSIELEMTRSSTHTLESLFFLLRSGIGAIYTCRRQINANEVQMLPEDSWSSVIKVTFCYSWSQKSGYLLPGFYLKAKNNLK